MLFRAASWQTRIQAGFWDHFVDLKVCGFVYQPNNRTEYNYLIAIFVRGSANFFGAKMEIQKSPFLDITSYSRYYGAVDAAIVPLMSYVLLGAGLIFMAYFFVYEVTASRASRDLKKEIVVSSLAALFLGVGTVFMMIWVGIYP